MSTAPPWPAGRDPASPTQPAESGGGRRTRRSPANYCLPSTTPRRGRGRSQREGGRVAGTCPRELGRSARARGAEQLRLRNAFPPPARAHHTNQTSSRAIVTRLSEPDQSRKELGQTRPPPPTLTPPCNGRVPYPQRGRGGRALRVRFPFAVGDFALRVIGAS